MDFRTLSASTIVVLAATLLALIGLVVFSLLTICNWLGCVQAIDSAWFVAVMVCAVFFSVQPILRAWERRPRTLLVACVVVYCLIGGWVIAARSGLFTSPILNPNSTEGPLIVKDSTIRRLVITDSAGKTWECYRQSGHPAFPATARAQFRCRNGQTVTITQDGLFLTTDSNGPVLK